jgi:dTMP kinase
MSKLPESEWDDYIAFQEDFEYNKIKVPKPDLVVYLDVEPDVSQKLMSKRYAGDENKKDLHEKNVNFLLECRKSALYAADKLGWVKVSCTENGEMKTIEEIADEIKAVIINRM